MQRRFYKALCAAHCRTALCASAITAYSAAVGSGGKLQTLQKTVHVQRPAAPVKTMIHKSRCCKTGTLVTIDVFGKRGLPSHYFTGQHSAPDE